MRITRLKTGDIFKSDDSASDVEFFLQVTADGDAGIFLGGFDPDRFDTKSPIFRVIVADNSVKKDLLRMGNFPVHPALIKENFYYKRDIGTENFERIAIMDPSLRSAISKKEAEELEELAVWEIGHILARIKSDFLQ